MINLILISAFIRENIFDLACVNTQQYVENNKVQKGKKKKGISLLNPSFFSTVEKGRGTNNTISMNHIARFPFGKCGGVIKTRV